MNMKYGHNEITGNSTIRTDDDRGWITVIPRNTDTISFILTHTAENHVNYSSMASRLSREAVEALIDALTKALEHLDRQGEFKKGAAA